MDPGENFWTEEEIMEEQRLYAKDEANETLEKLFQASDLTKNLAFMCRDEKRVVVLSISPQYSACLLPRRLVLSKSLTITHSGGGITGNKVGALSSSG